MPAEDGNVNVIGPGLFLSCARAGKGFRRENEEKVQAARKVVYPSADDPGRRIIQAMPPIDDILDRLLDPVGRALSPDAARKVVSLRADAEAQARIDELADRCNEGTLSPEERDEYASLVALASAIALLQNKARASLA
jgi:hypothetical protein